MNSDTADKIITTIIESANFDKEAFRKYTGSFLTESERVSRISNILVLQYADTDIDKILQQKDINEIIDFLNRFIRSKNEFGGRDRSNTPKLNVEESEVFLDLASQTEKIPPEKLCETAPLLTVNSYLEMCRIVYDAAAIWKYPEDISTEFLFCDARMWSYEHEYNEGILGIDRDSPEKFAKTFYTSYHCEELWFGGPKFYMHDESAHLGRNLWGIPKVFGKWTGKIYCDENDGDIYKAVKMYIALREKEYPVYFGNYAEIYDRIKKGSYA